MSKHYFCPFCGETQFQSNAKCVRCKRNISLIESKYDWEYYRDKAIEMYNDNRRWRDILFWEEIFKNPLYDKSSSNKTVSQDEHKQILNQIAYRDNNSHSYVPKCPTCQSPNIHKLSTSKRAVHGLAFGLFSKTARSQWECKDCGNKW